MTKPCPLYLKPADLLAAFSGDLDGIAEPAQLARRPRRFTLSRMRMMLPTGVRRPWRPSPGGRSAQPQALACGTVPGFDPRPSQVGMPAQPLRSRGLLSHFALVQTGA